MNLMGIFSLILITSSSVLCRGIIRPNFDNATKKKSSNSPELVEKTFEIEGSKILEPRTTPANKLDETIKENYSAPDDQFGKTESFDNEDKFDVPISKERIQKMLKKAIIQIITGDLTSEDMKLLESLNYDAEQVHMIREEELKKRKNQLGLKNDRIKSRNGGVNVEHNKPNIDGEMSIKKNDYDYEEFNKQATLDYENAATNYDLSSNHSWTDSIAEYEDLQWKSSTEESMETVGSMRPNIVFKINYNDVEFDSSSEENHQTTINGTGNNFPAVTTSVNSSPAPVDDNINNFSELFNITRNYFSTTDKTIEDNDVNSQTIPSVNKNELTTNSTELPEILRRYKNVDNYSEVVENNSTVLPEVGGPNSSTEIPMNVTKILNSDSNSTISPKKYKGLKWLQDNVYQVLPEFLEAIPSEVAENETSASSSYEDIIYQDLYDVSVENPIINEDLVTVEETINDAAPDPIQLIRSNISEVENSANLTLNQQIATKRRQHGTTSSIIISQRQKTENDIKLRILAFTGRLNSTFDSTALIPPTEKLAMYSPTCGLPRNTDTESWQDPYAMNMNFQMNLTSDQHLVAAKLRIYKLPQENLTATTSTMIDGVENEEKKIRISVYYYLKSLKKNRVRKRLMDSKVTSLSGTGEQLALDVKNAARHWRSTTRNTNHGLVVLVEDQEGHPLQPTQYIQTSNCHVNTNADQQDDKTNVSLHSSFEPVLVTFVS